MFKKLLVFAIILVFIFLQWSDLSSKTNTPPLVEPVIDIEENPVKEVVKHTIVIDPGHGPWVNNDLEPISPNSKVLKRKYGVGTVGNITGIMEREINLNVSLMLRDLLEKDGFIVIMTRTNHEVISSNIDRVNLANDNHADLMIRVHSDSYKDTSIHGASMLVPADVGYAGKIVDISRNYGEIVLDTLVNAVGMANRGVITRDDQTGFNWSKVPIMTVEMGFLSNKDEEKLLSSPEYQEKLAHALYLGIANCFKEDKTGSN